MLDRCMVPPEPAIPYLPQGKEIDSLEVYRKISKAGIILGEIVKKQPEDEQNKVIAGLTADLRVKGKEDISQHLEDISGVDAQIRNEIAISGKHAFPGLVKALRDENKDIRRNAAVVLANMASVMEIGLQAVRAALREYGDGKGDNAMREAAGLYKCICSGVSKRLAGRYAKEGEGLVLVGRLSRRPQGTYHQLQKKAFA